MNNGETKTAAAPEAKTATRAGFLQKISQLAEAWDFDPQEALFLEVKALRNEVHALRETIALTDK